MPSSLSGKYEKPAVSLKTAVLTALFVSSFMLAVVSSFFPFLMIPSPAAVFSLLFLVALVNAVYFLSVQELKIPFLLHLLFFTAGQWLFAAAWLRLAGVAGLPEAFNFRVMLEKEKLRPVMTIITSVLSLSLTASGGRLQRIPKVESSSGLRILWEETANRVDVSSWEAEWQSCRAWIISLIIGGIVAGPAGGLLLPERNMDQQSRFWPAVLAVTGLLLLTEFYFFYKRALWKAEGMVPDRELPRAWFRWAVLITGGAAGVSLLLPAGFPGLGRIIAGLGQKIMDFLTRQSREPESFLPPAGNGTWDRLIEGEPGLWEKIAGLLFFILIYLFLPFFVITCLLVFAGWLLFRLGRREIERWKGWRQALVRLFLFWRNLWTRRRFQPQPRRKEELFPHIDWPNGRRKKRRRRFWGRGYRAVIRRGYFLLVDRARRQGLPWRSSQTPGEIADRLKEALPGEEKVVDELTGSYRLARYGPREPSRLLAKAFEDLRRAVQKRMSRLKD